MVNVGKYNIPWEPTTFIFRGYDPYIEGLNLHFSWFWGPKVYGWYGLVEWVVSLKLAKGKSCCTS